MVDKNSLMASEKDKFFSDLKNKVPSLILTTNSCLEKSVGLGSLSLVFINGLNFMIIHIKLP